MIFTAGAVTHYDKAVGFRVYDRFQDSQASHGQVVVVFDSDTGDFKGVIVGGHLGAMRTGAIGGVAIKHMARPDASRAAILGSGRQARTLLEAAAVVRRFASVKVYSPNTTRPRGICPRDARDARPARCPRWISTRGCRGCRCGHVRHHDHHARVRSQLAQTRCPHQHRGAPSQGESELDASIAERVRVVATDSRRQLRSYTQPYFLADTPWMEGMVELGVMVVGKQTAATPPMTLPCSARQASQALRSPSPAKRSDGRVIVRGCEAGVPPLMMMLAHAAEPSILLHAQWCQPEDKTGNAPSRRDHMAREGGNDASDDDPHR